MGLGLVDSGMLNEIKMLDDPKYDLDRFDAASVNLLRCNDNAWGDSLLMLLHHNAKNDVPDFCSYSGLEVAKRLDLRKLNALSAILPPALGSAGKPRSTLTSASPSSISWSSVVGISLSTLSVSGKEKELCLIKLTNRDATTTF